MDKIHAKSPCCRARVVRAGERRRQCRKCRRTWRIRKKRRGRKRIRRSAMLIKRIFTSPHTLTGYKGKLPIGVLRSRFRATLRWFLNRSAPPEAPAGPLVLIVDGLWFTFKGVRWVLYLRALKPIGEAHAYFLDPVLLPGRELPGRWALVINYIPDAIQSRVIAFVSDGFRISRRLASREGWIYQHCHFHLLAQLQVNRGQWKFAKRADRALRERVYQTVRALLVETDSRRLAQRVRRLRALLRQPECPGRLRSIAREFLRNLDAFRAYLRYPELNLPTTTNVVESLNHRLRDMTHMLPTPASLRAWATGLIRTVQKMKCNGHSINRIK